MKNKTLYLLVLAIALISFQCKSTKSGSMYDKDLKEGEFIVEQLNGRQITDHELTFIIDANKKRISGQSSCNNYGVSYEINENGVLDKGFVIATKMYCDNEMKLENEFIKAVGDFIKFEYAEEETKLNLFDEEGNKLIELQKK